MARGCAAFAKVKSNDIYPGIDVVYYGRQGELGYDLVLSPLADSGAIRMAVSEETVGSSSALTPPRIDRHGDLVLGADAEELRLRKPVIYQASAAGRRIPVDGGYALNQHGEVSFEVGAYDRSKPLVIDPVLAYSTFLGGSSGDNCGGIAVDRSGNIYVAGTTNSTDFPTVNPIQALQGGAPFYGDAFVAKIKADGTGLEYSTYLGGDNGEGVGGIAVDPAGNTYITGSTWSKNFPTRNALQPRNAGGSDGFVAKISPTGALVYSTYVGGAGTDFGNGIAVDGVGNAYVAGSTGSVNFPVRHALESALAGVGYSDAFISKISPDGGSLVFSTFLGGYAEDSAYGIALDSSGNIYVTGYTESPNFPLANPAQSVHRRGLFGDIFVSKLSPDGRALLYSTFWGGTGEDVGLCIAADDAGFAYVSGLTYSADFPTRNALQSMQSANGDAFLVKIDTGSSGLNSVAFSTYLGGGGHDIGEGIAVDTVGRIYLVGETQSTDFPTTPDAVQNSLGGGSDGFLTVLAPDGLQLLYSTFIGGGGGSDSALGVAVAGLSVYITGWTDSADFPTTAGVLQTTLSGNSYAFVARLMLKPDILLSVVRHWH
jgi:hypothetical protein